MAFFVDYQTISRIYRFLQIRPHRNLIIAVASSVQPRWCWGDTPQGAAAIRVRELLDAEAEMRLRCGRDLIFGRAPSGVARPGEILI